METKNVPEVGSRWTRNDKRRAAKTVTVIDYNPRSGLIEYTDSAHRIFLGNVTSFLSKNKGYTFLSGPPTYNPAPVPTPQETQTA